MIPAEPAAQLACTQPGTILGGKYRVEELIGAGGMGVVVRARHLVLDEVVAIKFLRPAFAAIPESAARFLREAKVSLRIRSEHVPKVLDVGALESGEPFMVLEHLEGCDLADVVKRGGPLPVEIAVDFMIQACRGLADALVHG